MLISPDEINKSMSNYGWKYENKKISKSYSFKTYINGIEFVQKIAELAEKNNHHPDIYIGWCNVYISITSHDLGGVTTNCVNLAKGIDNIFEITTVGLPRGMVNRVGFDTDHQLGKDEWSSVVQTELAKAPIFGITLSSDVSSGNGTISVTAEALTNINLDKIHELEDYKIVVCLTENNIVQWQKDNTSGDIENYEHNHVLRAMLNTTFGESIGNSFVDGDIWEKDYSVDITTLENANENYSLNTLFMGNGNCKGWNEENMEIVAYIYNTNNYEIVQVEDIHLTNH